MKVFLDFEASSLSKASYPIEVAWVFEGGEGESHLIQPTGDWTDWDEEAQGLHGLSRSTLVAEGKAAKTVARRMVAALEGHELFASAPSWDGKWLSALLRAGGLPRHALRLRDTDEAARETAEAILRGHVPEHALAARAEELLALTELRDPTMVPAHRALPDAEAERRRWLAVRAAAVAYVAGRSSGRTEQDSMPVPKGVIDRLAHFLKAPS